MPAATLTFSPNAADSNAWNKPQKVTITAVDDAAVEGFEVQKQQIDARIAAIRHVLDGGRTDTEHE